MNTKTNRINRLLNISFGFLQLVLVVVDGMTENWVDA